MPKRKTYTDQVEMKLDDLDVVPHSKTIKALNATKWPQTVDGWVRRLNKAGFDLDQVALMEALFNSGMAQEALSKYEKRKDNIPFETIWELYNYTVGSKFRAEKAWRRLSVVTQRKVIDAVVRYNRYCQVTGVFKKQLTTYLNGRSYLQELPGPEKWQKWRKVLKNYAEKTPAQRRNPSYLSSDEAIDLALESLLYRYPDAKITQVMGIFRWMATDWERKYWQFISIVRACDVNKFSERLIAASKHIQVVETAMQSKTDRMFAYDPDNVERRIYEKLAEEAKNQDTTEEE
jgi:hypothetical protein